MFNNRKINKLQKELDELTESFYSFRKESCKEVERLSFLLDNPIKCKVGDTPFKGITITSIKDTYDWSGYRGLCTPFYEWKWEVKAFDSKNKIEIYLKLDCGNNLINPNK